MKTIKWQVIPIPAGLRAIDHYRTLLPLIEAEIGAMSGKTEDLVLHCEPDLFVILQCQNQFYPSVSDRNKGSLMLKPGALPTVSNLEKTDADRVSYGVVKFGETPVLEITLTNGLKKYS